MRDPKLQKKAINYTLDKARPVIQKVGSEMLDQLSTKVRPNQRYKTDRPDAIAMQHDVDYDVCSNREKKYGENLKKCKHKADKKMVRALDAVPYKQRQWGHAAARNTINAKQKLRLGLKQQKGLVFWINR